MALSQACGPPQQEGAQRPESQVQFSSLWSSHFLVREAAGLRQGCEWERALPKSFFGWGARDRSGILCCSLLFPNSGIVRGSGESPSGFREIQLRPGMRRGMTGRRGNLGPGRPHQAASLDRPGPPPSTQQNAISRLFGGLKILFTPF